MRKAYSYVRFSTSEQAQGDSYRRQNDAARAYAAQHHLELDEHGTYEDLGVSGYRGTNVETGMLGAFREAVRLGTVPGGSVLLVENLDRLSRQNIIPALGVLVSICNAGVSVVTLSDGKEYTAESVQGDPWALLVPVVTFMRANEESVTKGRRLRAAWDNKRAKAKDKPLTSVCPAWLTADAGRRFAPIPDRVKVVRRIYSLALAGHGPHKITELLNAEKVPPFVCPGEQRGRAAEERAIKWHRLYVSTILSSPAVVGTLIPATSEYVGDKRVRIPQKPVRGYYPVIIKRSVYDRVQALRAVRAPTGKAGASGIVRNVFGRLAVCPKCGGRMEYVNKGKANGTPYLVCGAARVGAGCTYRAVRYDALEAALLLHAGKIVGQAALAGPDASIEKALSETEAALYGVGSALGHIIEAIELGEFSEALTERRRALEGERDTLQAKLSALSLEAANAAGPLVAAKLRELGAALSGPSLERRLVNALLRQLLTGTIIDYPAGRVLLRWRHGGESEFLYTFPGHGARLRKPSPSRAAAEARAAKARSRAIKRDS